MMNLKTKDNNKRTAMIIFAIIDDSIPKIKKPVKTKATASGIINAISKSFCSIWLLSRYKKACRICLFARLKNKQSKHDSLF